MYILFMLYFDLQQNIISAERTIIVLSFSETPVIIGNPAIATSTVHCTIVPALILPVVTSWRSFLARRKLRV